MAKIMISGYHGFGNIGDEAVLVSLIDRLKIMRPDCRLVVLSCDPELTSKMYDVESVKRTSFSQINHAMKSCDLLISGGGSLLQDVTGIGSIPYYLGIIKLAKMNGLKVSIFAQGIGPIKRGFLKKCVTWILNQVDSITIRDLESLNLIKEIGVEHEAKLVADPAIVLAPFQVEKGIFQDEIDSDTVVFCVRQWPGYEGIEVNLSECMDKIHEEFGLKPVILPFHPDEDMHVSLKLSNATKCSVEIFTTDMDPKKVKGIISKAGLVVGMRLHSLIFAASCRVPFVGISYDPKVKAFCESVGQASLDLSEAVRCGDTNSIYAAIKEVIARKDLILAKLNEVMPEMENLAYLACDEAISPLGDSNVEIGTASEEAKSTCDIFGLQVSTSGIEDVIKFVIDRFEEGNGLRIVTLNPEMAELSKKDVTFRAAIEYADIIVPDGIGIVIGGRILGSKMSGRVPGIDLSYKLLTYCAKNNKKAYFLGGAKGVAEAAGKVIYEKYGTEIVGVHDGYFHDDAPVIKDILDKKPDLVLVGMGMKLQEEFIKKYQDELPNAIWMGVGGTFDVMSGNIKRAPEFFQKMGLEWLYRAVTQPARIKRLFAIPAFMVNVVVYKFRKEKN